MIFARTRKTDTKVFFGEQELSRIEGAHKYLGIWMEENMSFRHHVGVVRAKAWAALQGIRPLAKHGLGFDTF